jgi:hypothetical protein
LSSASSVSRPALSASPARFGWTSDFDELSRVASSLGVRASGSKTVEPDRDGGEGQFSRASFDQERVPSHRQRDSCPSSPKTWTRLSADLRRWTQTNVSRPTARVPSRPIGGCGPDRSKIRAARRGSFPPIEKRIPITGGDPIFVPGGDLFPTGQSSRNKVAEPATFSISVADVASFWTPSCSVRFHHPRPSASDGQTVSGRGCGLLRLCASQTGRRAPFPPPAIQSVRPRPAFGGSSTLDSGPRLRQALGSNPIVPRVIDSPRANFLAASGELVLVGAGRCDQTRLSESPCFPPKICLLCQIRIP